MTKLPTRSHVVPERIQRLEDFQTYGNFRGTTRIPYHGGWLYGHALTVWNDLHDQIDYVVLSYSTPIAWHAPGFGWYRVDKSFSASSGRHQQQVRVALWQMENVTVLMPDYKLSDAQAYLIGMLQGLPTGPIRIRGERRRTADKLAQYGLIDYDRLNDTISITDKGRGVAL